MWFENLSHDNRVKASKIAKLLFGFAICLQLLWSNKALSTEINGKSVILYNCIQGDEIAKNDCGSVSETILQLIKTNKRFGALDLNDYKKMSQSLNFIIKGKNEDKIASNHEKKTITPFLGCSFNQYRDNISDKIVNTVEIYNDMSELELCLKYSFILDFEGGGFTISKNNYQEQIDAKFDLTFN